MSKWIQIWYSWGEQESPIEVKDGIDAWEYLKQLVAKEVFVSQEEYPYGCSVYAYVEGQRVEIHYHKDDEWCYYLITDEEDFDVFDEEEDEE